MTLETCARGFRKLVGTGVVHAGILAVMAAIMLRLTWQTWPDPMIDFGEELYTAWQLADGQRLGIDILHVKGPLSPYLNALWFRIFGVGLQTIVWCNLAMLGLFTWALYRVIQCLSDSTTALWACVTYLSIFAFGQYLTIGNYNFVCPYSHEVTHGLALALVSLQALLRYKSGRWGWLCVEGLCLGLALLTDPAVALALLIAQGTGLIAAYWSRPSMSPTLGKATVLWFGSVALAPVMAWVLLCRVVPPNLAWRQVLGGWHHLLTHRPFAQPFYRWVLGIDDVAGNFRILLTCTVWYVVGLGSLTWLALWLGRTKGRTRTMAHAMVLLIVGLAGSQITWGRALRPLPIFLIATIFVVFVAWHRNVRRGHEDDRGLGRLVVLLFALALLAKMMLNVHVQHYGFVLAMPGTLALVVVLLYGIPAWIEQQGGAKTIFQGASLILLLHAIVVHLTASASLLSEKTFPLSFGADRIMTDWRGKVIAQALEAIATQVRQDQTLLVLPEGAMINYLARRRTPLAWLRVSPYALTLWTERRALEALQTTSPDYILWVSRDYSEDGPSQFGQDYGQQLGVWILHAYREQQLFGEPPFFSDRFGMLLLRRAGPRDLE